MHNDLAQMAKAKGIYRTLGLLAILSPKPAMNKTSKCSLKKEGHEADKQVNAGDVGIKDKCMVSPR